MSSPAARSRVGLTDLRFTGTIQAPIAIARPARARIGAASLDGEEGGEALMADEY